MDVIKSVKYQPVASVRSSKVKQTNGMQKLYSKFLHKIEDLPPRKNTTTTRSTTSLNGKTKKLSVPPASLVQKSGLESSFKAYENVVFKNDTVILSDDDEFYSKLSFDNTEQSLEDEIFEELEKVAHDEAKLNAAIENFDKILLEYNDRKSAEAREKKVIEKPVVIHKPLQKSKTCSIIESKCILKNEENQENLKKETKSEKPSKLQPISSLTTSANYYQVTKSLWNLQDLEDFAKSKTNDSKSKNSYLNYKTQFSSPSPNKLPLQQRKSEGIMGSTRNVSVKSMLPKAKSVWELSSSAHSPSSLSLVASSNDGHRPTYNRQSSISRIPIKLSNFSTSMLQLNLSANSSRSNSTLNSSSTAGVTLPPKLRKSSVYASTTALTNSCSVKTSASRRSSLNLAVKKVDTTPPRCAGKYIETKTSLNRRSMLSSQSTNALNKMSLSMSIPHSKLSPVASSMNSSMVASNVMKSARSELSLNQKSSNKSHNQKQQKVMNNFDPIQHHHKMTMKPKTRESDKQLDKCLVKGQESLRKAEEFNEHNTDGHKRDYISQHIITRSEAAKNVVKPPTTPSVSSIHSKQSPNLTLHKKSSLKLVNSGIKNLNHNGNNTNETLNINAIANLNNRTGNNHHSKALQQQIESEKTIKLNEIKPVPVVSTTLMTKSISVAAVVCASEIKPTVELCQIIIPPVLGSKPRDCVDGKLSLLKEKDKDYSSDCSDDSGHISNENEELTSSHIKELEAPMIPIKNKMSGKISEELLEMFENKSVLLKSPAKQAPAPTHIISPTKAKVIELNHVNMIKSSMEIYPALNKSCKSEVTFFINKY